MNGRKRYPLGPLAIMLSLIFTMWATISFAGLAKTPWPKFRHDAQNTGRSPYKGSQTNTLKWKFATDDWIQSSPAIGSDGTIYVGSEDNYDIYLYAIKPDGSLKWRFETGDGIGASPAIGSDGTIYVGSNDFNLYAIGKAGCPLQTTTNDQSKLNLYREFRDKSLSQSESGREYTRLYYKHSPEVSLLFLKDSRLRNQAKRLLDRAIPEIRLIFDGKRDDLSLSLKNGILSFLGYVSQKASPELKADIERLIGDIEEGRTKEILGGIDPTSLSILPKNLALFSLIWPLGIPLAFVTVRSRVKRM